MIKFYCDICQKEIKKENNLFGNFTYLTKKIEFFKHNPEKKVVQVEMMLCEDCITILKRHIEDLIKDFKNV